ncbi:MerR family transcriptional regulator [Clostridium sp. MCC353]|uniref:MerR family transcriptional regulator n=1 Tax=Clostridium sp. MCC353 TaxID=2592646 RepID=UPI001C03223B|nr:MerR family transcriptional regulator [Clostridium sp. MCC353]MBT9776647.1 MerR family transcriptional regulator [Clostridium sp. MCC353]
MTIKEVEEKTGLARSNIRFYEKEKLIEPERNKTNGYREYSEKDVSDIKKIAYLRTLDIPVEEIRKIKTEEISLHQVLKNQEQKLETQISDLQNAKALCSRMLKEDEIQFETLNVDRYVKDLHDYWQDNRKVFKLDAVGFFYLWGGTAVWAGLTVLCLLAAVLSYPYLPDKIPIQWNKGEISSLAGRWFILVYPAACVALRYLFKSVIWRWLWVRGVFSESIADYIINFFCVTILSVECFTVLYMFGAARHVTTVLAVDGVLFMGLLWLGWNKSSVKKE